MNKWKPAKLGDIAETCLGKMLDKEKNKGVLQPYIANVNLRWGGFDLTNLSTMRFEESESERYGLKPGDLVVCEGGEPGRCAIWRGEIPEMKIQKAIHRVRTNKDYSNEFLFYRFLLAGRNGELKKHFIGSTIKHLTGFSLKQVEFDFPSLTEQQDIAKVLTALDAKIELNNGINAELEAMAKLLYDYWFVQFDFPMTAAQATGLGNPKLEGKPYRISGGKMIYNETLKREIPEGWEVRKLSAFCHHIRDTVDPRDVAPCMPYVGLEHVPRRRFTLDAWGTASSVTSLKSQFKSGDVLFGKLRPYFHKVVRAGIDGICTSELLVLRYIDPKFEGFLGSVLCSDVFVEATSNQWGGSKMPRAEWSRMKEYLVPCPPDDLLTNFNDRVLPMWELGATNQRQTQELIQLRDWLLPMLMNGQVTVN